MNIARYQRPILVSAANWNRIESILSAIICLSLASLASAQPRQDKQRDDPRVTSSSSAQPQSIDTLDAARWILDLGSSSYRVRQLARWRLEQDPAITLSAIEQSLEKVDHNIGSQLISILATLSTDTNVSISQGARSLLENVAEQPTYAGTMSSHILRNIAELQQVQAIQKLTLYGARIGRIGLRLHNTERAQIPSVPIVLHINADFQRHDDSVGWIQFLKSVNTVFIEDVVLDRKLLQAICKLSANLENLKLRHVQIDVDDLDLLQSLTQLEYLEISYSDIDDSAIEKLATLPISQYLHLNGTKITEDGELRLAKQLDSVKIFRANGGFLGVGTPITSTDVTTVLPGSGAQQAGIKQDTDKLTHIGNSPISNFEELRRELGRYQSGDSIKVTLDRDEGDGKVVPHTLKVVLGEEPTS